MSALHTRRHATGTPAATQAPGSAAAGAATTSPAPRPAEPTPAPGPPAPYDSTPTASPTPAAPPDGTAGPNRPTRYSGRIGGLDIARALAILGMFYAHVGPLPTPERSALIGFLDAIPDGRSSILFAVLAGISVSIITGRNVAHTGEHMRSARLRIFGRSAVLLVIAGLLSITNGPVMIILAFYAAWFVATLPFTSWSPRSLFIAAGCVAILGPITINFSVWFMLNTGFWPATDANGFLVDAFITGFYPGMTYMAYVLAGMAIGRLDITRRALKLRLVAAGCCLMILGYGSSWLLTQAVTPAATTPPPAADGVLAASFTPAKDPTVDPADPNAPVTDFPADDATSLTQRNLDSNADPTFICEPVAEPVEEATWGTGPSSWQSFSLPAAPEWVTARPHSNSMFEATGSGGFAIAMVGLCLLIGHLARNVLYPLAAVGTMSLSAYSFHVPVIAFNAAWVSQDSLIPAVWLIGGALVLCTVWKLFFTRGPLEWVTWKVSHMTARVAQPKP